MADKKQPATRVTLGSPEFPVRFSYIALFQPKEAKDDAGETVRDDSGVAVKKFSAQIRIPKKDKVGHAACLAAIEAARHEEFGDKKIANLKLPIRDGDEEWEEKDDESLKGHWFFNCSSKQKPNVVGPKKDELTGKLELLGESDIKSGDYGRVSVNFFGFTGKQKGIGVGLGNVQKLKDGDPLGNQRSADDDFGDLEDGFSD